MNLLIFGFGYSGRALARRRLAGGWTVSAAARSPEARAEAEALGVRAVDPADPAALAAAAAEARAILVTAPPGQAGCPGLAALAPAMALHAAEPAIKTLSLTEIVGVLLIRPAEIEIDFRRRSADAVRHQRDPVQRGGDRRIDTQLSLFALATRDDRQHQHQGG